MSVEFSPTPDTPEERRVLAARVAEELAAIGATAHALSPEELRIAFEELTCEDSQIEGARAAVAEMTISKNSRLLSNG